MDVNTTIIEQFKLYKQLVKFTDFAIPPANKERPFGVRLLLEIYKLEKAQLEISKQSIIDNTDTKGVWLFDNIL
uniref:Uncharacterized protein n=1 Tax=Romanomermis culicivorax TaxID=13658 RepID=A0A915JE26_ROMCU